MFFGNEVQCLIVEKVAYQQVRPLFNGEAKMNMSFDLGSLSADRPLSLEFSQSLIGSDDLEPCIEDIRSEIDRLRREEQLLRQRYICSKQSLVLHRFLLVIQLNRIVLISVPFPVLHKKFTNYQCNEKSNQFILSAPIHPLI